MSLSLCRSHRRQVHKSGIYPTKSYASTVGSSFSHFSFRDATPRLQGEHRVAGLLAAHTKKSEKAPSTWDVVGQKKDGSGMNEVHVMDRQSFLRTGLLKVETVMKEESQMREWPPSPCY